MLEISVIKQRPFVFSHVKYIDINFVYGFCNGNARADVDQYHRRFPDRRSPSRGVFSRFTGQCVRLVVFQVLLCSLKGRWYHWLTHERTFFRWFREVHDCPLVVNIKYQNDIRWVSQNTALFYGVSCQKTDNMFRPFSIRPSSGLTWWTKEEITMLQSTYIHSMLWLRGECSTRSRLS